MNDAKKAPMQRIHDLEREVQTLNEALARDIAARDEFKASYERTRTEKYAVERELNTERAKFVNLQAEANHQNSRFTGLSCELVSAQTEVRVLREMLDRVMPAKKE